MPGTAVFVALSLATLLAGQNGQGASARDSSNQSNQSMTPQLEIGARTYSGERPVATASSGTGDVVNGTVWIDPSGCGVGSASAASANVRGSTPGPSAVRWTYTGHIVDRTAGGVIADIEWERSSVNYGDLPKSTKRVNLRVGESVVIDELVPKAPDNLCGASALRLEASLVVPARGFRGGGGAGFGGRGTMASGGGSGAGSGVGATSATRGATGGGGAGLGAGGVGAGGFGAASQLGDDLRARALAARDVANMHTIPGASYDAEAWLVHTPPGGPEETQRVEVHVDSDGQAFQFPGVTITTSHGPARVDVAAMLRPVANANGGTMLVVAIVRRIEVEIARIDASDPAVAERLRSLGYVPTRVTGDSTKVIPLPSPTDIISFELPDTHGTAFDVLSGHQFSVRVRIAKK